MIRPLVIAAVLSVACAPTVPAAIYSPGETVPGLSNDVFTWNEGDTHSTFAFWDTFATFPGGSIPGAIAPGISPEANTGFANGGTMSDMTFDSYASITSGGNAYGFNFLPGQPAFQPEFITDAYATVRSGTTGGSNTRIVAQWQTQGAELDPASFLLSLSPGAEGTIAPSLSLETGRSVVGSFTLVNRMAVWDLDSSQDAYRIDFNANSNHVSLDQFRIDTYTSAVPFTTPTSIPEPSSFGMLALGVGAFVMRRRRRR